MNTPGPDAALLAQVQGSKQSPDLKSIKASSPEQAGQIAEDFEAFFIGQMVQAMFSGVETPEPFGGGAGEKAWQGMLHEEFGKIIAKSGGLGMADDLKSEIIRLQTAESEGKAEDAING